MFTFVTKTRHQRVDSTRSRQDPKNVNNHVETTKSGSLARFVTYLLLIGFVSAAGLSDRAFAGATENVLEAYENIQNLKQRMENVTWVIEDFLVYSYYCDPPLSEERNKAVDFGALNHLGRIAKELESEFNAAVSTIMQNIAGTNRSGPAINALLQEMPSSASPTNPNWWRRAYGPTIAKMRQALSAKRAAVQAAPERDCRQQQTQQSPSSTTPPEDEVGLGDVEIFEPNYYDVTYPEVPETVCTQAEYHALRVAVALERGNAGFNMNQANGVVWSIKAAIRVVTVSEDQQHLQQMLQAAQQDFQQRIRVLDTFDELFDKAKAVQVVDCDDDETSFVDPADSGNQDLGYALMNAMQNNPYKSGEGVTPALNAGYGTDVLYDAETANHDRTRDVLQAVRRDKERQDYGLPNVYDVDSSSVETQTEYIKVPRSQVGETANATDNPAGRENIFYDEPVPPEGIQVSPNHLNTRNLQLNVPNGQEAEESVPTAYSLDSPTGLVGFGTSSTVNRAARTGRNPRTGEPVQIPASLRPQFKAGKGLED